MMDCLFLGGTSQQVSGFVLGWSYVPFLKVIICFEIFVNLV